MRGSALLYDRHLHCMSKGWEFPMDMRIPPLEIKSMLEPNPPKSRILVRRLADLRICFA